MKEFSPSLESWNRAVVHELAEMYGLEHFSIGHGKERQVMVTKPQ